MFSLHFSKTNNNSSSRRLFTFSFKYINHYYFETLDDDIISLINFKSIELQKTDIIFQNKTKKHYFHTPESLLIQINISDNFITCNNKFYDYQLITLDFIKNIFTINNFILDEELIIS